MSISFHAVPRPVSGRQPLHRHVFGTAVIVVSQRRAVIVRLSVWHSRMNVIRLTCRETVRGGIG